MRHYEIMYILVPNLDNKKIKEERKNLEDIITSNGGKITKEDIWGLKDIAYPIKKYKQGYYVVIDVEAPAKAISEFNRLAKINKSELRHMIINRERILIAKAKKETVKKLTKPKADQIKNKKPFDKKLRVKKPEVKKEKPQSKE